MKAIASFLLVTAFFVAINVVAAATMLGLGLLVPSWLKDEPFVWIVVGLIGVAASVAFAMGVVRLIGRASWRAPARARG